jgi:predicted ATPase/transcriptional regulator with XRE-family HTH domain/Tfp pilus assembly protein PilF
MKEEISFGKWLKQQRQQRDLTQEELAQLTACSLSTIRKIESDQRRPSKQLAEQLARQFQLSAEEQRGFVHWVRSRDNDAPPQSESPPPRVHARATNLPTPPTTFIGRENEVAAVIRLLERPGVRLLTLTGPPGIGKTRLALQAAGAMLPEFADGVWFVGLAALTDPALVPQTVAAALGLKEEIGEDPVLSLKERLAGRSMLLLLDNFEQVLPAASAVADLLAAAPDLKALVTSRAALLVYGEQQFPVPGLEAPDPHAAPAHERAADYADYAAVRLFAERAQAVKPDFELTEKDAPIVAEICARLDGLPLAIELAAARSRLFPPHALLTRLQSRLNVLTGGARDLPVRQQTLRDAIAWSYDLLEPGEQRLFRRLGVLVSGGALDAVEAICADPDDPDADLITGLESLVSKSLLQQEATEDEEPRFVMLETLREYALDRLIDAGEADAFRRRHGEYFLTLAEEAEPDLNGALQPIWLDRLEREHDNLRAALAWFAEQNAPEESLRLAGALWRFWEVRGPVREGRRWLEAALAAGGGAPPQLRAKALNAAGNLAFDEDDYARATVLHQESLTLRRAAGDRAGIAAALSSLGHVAQRQGAQARAYHEESIAIRRAEEDWPGVVRSLIDLGALAAEKGDPEQAQQEFEEALALARSLGDPWSVALALNHLGEAALQQGDHDRAETLLEESLELFRQLRDKRSSARALGALGMLARKQTDFDRGQPLYKESLALFQELGARYGVAVCLEGLAAVAGGQGEPERAARLRGAAEALRAQIGAPRPPDPRRGAERRAAGARVSGDPSAVAVAWNEGQGMSLEQAVSYALEEPLG